MRPRKWEQRDQGRWLWWSRGQGAAGSWLPSGSPCLSRLWPVPAPPHPPWWATAAPSPRDLCQAEKLPQSSEGQSREKQISIKHSVPGPHQAFVPCLSYPRPSPGQLLVGRGLRTGGPLGFPGAGGAEGGWAHLCPPCFQVSVLVLGPALRDPTLACSSQRDACGPVWAPGQAGVEVLWGAGAVPGWRVRGFSTRRGGCPEQQRPEPGILAAGLWNGGRPRPNVPLRARQTGRWQPAHAWSPWSVKAEAPSTLGRT